MDVDVITEGETEEPEYEIPFNLDTLRKHLSQVVLARRVLPNDVAARQKLLEESVYDVAVERLKHQSELIEDLGLGNKGLQNVDLRTWMWNWHLKLQVRLKAEVDALQEEERRIPTGSGRRSDPYRASALGPFLSLLKPEKLSLIAILELMHLQGTGGVIDGMKTARALLAVGKAVELEYKAEMCKKHNVAIPTSTGRPNERGYFTALAYRELHNHRIAAQKYLEDAEDWTSDWTQAVRVKIGSFLVDALMDVATVVRTAVDKKTGEVVTEEQPAFFHSYEYIRGYKLGVIKLNPEIAEKMAKESLRETLHPRHLPMLVKPKPWLNYDQGGYLFNRTYAMRFKDSQEQQNYLRHAAQMGNLELIFAGLDVLGSTPWQINRSVFDVVLEVWNSGVRWEKIPPAAYDVAEPGKPENHETEPKARVYYMMRMKNWQLQKAANHSDRCSVNYKIEIARAFLGDTIYFPHNVDFRGRAYPLPPHLSHIGDDLSRGLLKFGEAKPLGERGLRWLKIHLANLYGFDKADFDERVAFVDRQLDDIFDSATNPIHGRRWWTKADDPWQCLATCMELKAALESPNPYDYECALPVHQDGTCNGLQHYAALGGDAQGAKQVNLDVTERPADVYTYVANMVEQSMIEDREKGDYFATLLSGKIARKVVKQTVMTTVYGVTYIGAREQIEKQLKDRGDISAEECWGASAYVAKKVLGCIGDLFHGAKEIQNWLSVTARLISKSIPPERLEGTESPGTQSSSVESSDAQSSSTRFMNKSTLKKEQMTSVIWTTPLGLPIVQPYRATKRKQIITSLQTVYISDPSSPTIVNSQKQASAFPPNFIHSLDATHMMLTALECQTRGLTFASVHDSYWTHAGSIDEMSAIIRETFIALHSSDVLGKLAEEFRERYKGYKIPLTSINSAKLIQSLGLCLDSEIVAHNLDGTPAGTVPLSEVIRSNDDDADELADADEAEDKVSAAESEEGATESEEGAAKSKKGAAKGKKGKKKVGRPRTQTSTQSFSVQQLKNIFRESGFEGKFVELVDILPPLPKKGQFDVATIKKSLYFFS
ncbi:DNA/RNA polymerase [Wolfiporia cocos MD-104 SS10]|uniref:DNA-directed RNA polymerase n=1 Tax=Wolfiporia cocos (strain MD-104) TaxID=742152 RepID=A0A2H3JSM1_WOLCO|nr:DNA/RNA polymerase [Wolfiporia cocos MD-104 SS10]